jgi:4-hydroxy-3-methylbut-2-enyl diphosphate reductase
MTRSFRVLLARPRGFCRGVENAIDIVNLALELVGPPLYVKHAIVHNRAVIREFEQKGVIFVESVEEIPEGAVAVFSAHGSPPEDYQKARQRNIDVIDATCKLVTNVHNWAKRFAHEGYSVVVIGHRDHPEPQGILGNIPSGQRFLIETVEEAEALKVPDPARVACVTQTTLSVEDTRAIRDVLRQRFPALKEPPMHNSTICYATDNRQAAVRELAEHADVVLVVGSQASSNTNRLCEVAAQHGARAYRIDFAHEIDPEWLQGAQVVGVTSGASAPERLVREVTDRLRVLGAKSVEELIVVEENVKTFVLPSRLIELARERGSDLETLRGRRRASPTWS